MSKYYSRTTGGFYSSEIHCDAMPADAVAVTDELYAALFAAQETGKLIQSDADGSPIAVDPAAPSAAEVAKQQIGALESTITSRRIREALLGTDNGWLKSVDSQISSLRPLIIK